jgi:hypothetical protein
MHREKSNVRDTRLASSLVGVLVVGDRVGCAVLYVSVQALGLVSSGARAGGDRHRCPYSDAYSDVDGYLDACPDQDGYPSADSDVLPDSDKRVGAVDGRDVDGNAFPCAFRHRDGYLYSSAHRDAHGHAHLYSHADRL